MSAPPPSSQSLLLLTSSGPIPLGFVQDDLSIYLVARERSARWATEVLRSGTARLALDSGGATGGAELIRDEQEKTRTLALFRTKYGDDRFQKWYHNPARIIRVVLGDHSSVEGPGRYFSWLESEFDNVADDYDRHILDNRINRLLRDRSLAHLGPVFADAPALLEIGCGSGMETLPLLRAGHEILAVDISEKMLAVVRAKAKREGLTERLRTMKLRAAELSRLTSEFGAGSFDGGYSTYGAFNCEPDLRPIPAALHRVLRPKSRFVTAIYNRWCLFELLGYTLALQPRRALGRRSNPILVGASRFCVDVYAYSVPEICRLFESTFRVERLEGVPVVLPPSDLTGYAEKFARRFDRLARLDATLGPRWPFYWLGDHFLLTLARRDPEDPSNLRQASLVGLLAAPPFVAPKSRGRSLGDPRLGQVEDDGRASHGIAK